MKSPYKIKGEIMNSEKGMIKLFMENPFPLKLFPQRHLMIDRLDLYECQ